MLIILIFHSKAPKVRGLSPESAFYILSSRAIETQKLRSKESKPKNRGPKNRKPKIEIQFRNFSPFSPEFLFHINVLKIKYLKYILTVSCKKKQTKNPQFRNSRLNSDGRVQIPRSNSEILASFSSKFLFHINLYFIKIKYLIYILKLSQTKTD